VVGLGAMQMNREYDVIIIGAGIIGAAIGLEMARAGKKTLNIDKLPAAGYGSTSNSCAIIRTHYSTLQGTALAWESLFYWKQWADYLGTPDELGLARFKQTGVLIFKSNDSEFDTWRRHHDALSIPYEEWDTKAVQEKMPFLSTNVYGPPKLPDDPSFFDAGQGEISGGFFVPEGGYVSDPQLSTHNIQRAAEAAGGEFLFNQQVVDILKEDNRCTGVVLNGGRQILAPVVVNAAGPHSFVINRLADVEKDMNITTRALRHEVHFVPAPEGVDIEKQGAVMSDDDIGGYCRPEVGNAILIGSQDPKCDAQEWVEDPDNYDTEVSEAQWRAQVYRLALRIPELPIPAHPRGLVDLYDVTDDWIPIYDKSSLDGFYLAVGTSGNQYKTAPVVGKFMAKLIDACEKGQEHDNEPVMYSCPKTGVDLDLSFYSRLRKINADSSFSVLG